MTIRRYDNKWETAGMNKAEQVDILNAQMASDSDTDGDPYGHDHSLTNPGNGGPITANNVKFTPSGDLTSVIVSGVLTELNTLANLGRVHVPVRQTVLNGLTDPSTGQANFLSTTSGLAVNILGATAPVTIAFAYNFGSFGQIDYVATISSDITAAWSSLPTNSTCFLYIDRNISTGGLTYGYSLLTPIHATIAPTSPSSDQHWLDLNSFYMKRYTGSAWEIKQRVFVGEAVTGASSVTSVITYALKGEYDSGWFSIAANQNYTKNHNIGVKISDGLQTQFYFSMDSTGSDSSFAHSGFNTGTFWEGHWIKESTSNSRTVIKFGFGDYTQNYAGAVRTSGYYRVFIKRGW